MRRLEAHGLVAAEWGLSDNDRRARYYRLTSKAKRALVDERSAWRRFVEAVRRFIDDGAEEV